MPESNSLFAAALVSPAAEWKRTPPSSEFTQIPDPKPREAAVATRVLLVEEHKLMRTALRALLAGVKGAAVVADAGDESEALESLPVAAPDVVLMGVNTLETARIESVKRLIDALPGLKVIVLSAYSDKRFVLAMLEAGVAGYIVKSDEGEELFRALKAVAQGQVYLSPAVSAHLVEAVCGKSKGGRPCLAPRERQVLTLLAQGLHSPAIGQRLSIAPSTVEVHRRNIMRKVGVRGIAELTKYAIREGMASI